MVVHFDNAEPDLGRKGFQPELKELGERLSALMVTYLSAARDLLKNDTGAEADIGKEIKVHDWMRDQEEHEKNHPLVLTNQNFFLPMRRISMQSTPLCEQDAIVLFNQLIAGGVIRVIKLLSTSQVSQYDGMFRYVAEEPLDNLKFDKVTNPLGVYEEQLSKAYVGPQKFLSISFRLMGSSENSRMAKNRRRTSPSPCFGTSALNSSGNTASHLCLTLIIFTTVGIMGSPM